MKIDIKWLNIKGLYECPFCKKEFTKNGICSHIICKHTEKGQKRVKEHLDKYRPGKGHKGWNKGLTKETDERVKRIAEKHIGKEPWNKNKKDIFSKETLKQISTKMKEVTKKRVSCKGVGTGYKGWYKGYWCDSQWELAFLIYCLDNKIDIKRNTEYFYYEYKEKVLMYYPDFIINNEYIEIKGFKREKDYYKFKQFPSNKVLKVYYYKDLKNVFEFVLKKYKLKNINDIHLLYDECYKKA